MSWIVDHLKDLHRSLTGGEVAGGEPTAGGGGPSAGGDTGLPGDPTRGVARRGGHADPPGRAGGRGERDDRTLPGPGLRRRLLALFRRERLDDELDDELRFHVEMHVEQLVDRGMDPRQARREALRLFGGVEKVKEECRDERRVQLVDGLVQDLRLAVRALRRAPGFAAAAVVTLALGIGANTAVFSLVNGVLLQPLPYPEGDRLVLLERDDPATGQRVPWFSIAEAHDLQARLTTLSGLAEHHGMSFTLLGHGDPRRVNTGVVSIDYFDVLGVDPLHGRTFKASDDVPGADAVLVVGHDFWVRELDADPDVVGELFEMNDRPHRIVGVLPPMPQYPESRDVYMPTSACPFRAAGDAERRAGDRLAFTNLHLFGRLGDADLDDLQKELGSVAGDFARRHPDVYGEAGHDAGAVPLQEALTATAQPRLVFLLGTVGLVLLIACANVANLMTARVLQRQRELSLRTALGASRARILRQLLTESTLIAVTGGALGLLLAAGSLDLLVQFFSRFTARAAGVAIDGPVLGFTLVVSVAVGVLFGIVPALGTGGDVRVVLEEAAGGTSTAGRRTRRLRSALVVGQVAVSFVLLIGAGLMGRSLARLYDVDPGFDLDDVAVMEIFANWSAYDDEEAQIALYENLAERLQEGPGVVSVGVANRVPLTAPFGGPTEYVTSSGLDRDWRPGAPLRPHGAAMVVAVNDGYFRTLGLEPVAGRLLTEADQVDRSRAIVVSRSVAGRHWPGKEALGQRISAVPAPGEAPDWYRVVGVVADVRDQALDRATGGQIYQPFTVAGMGGMFVVRSSAEPAVLSAFIREVVREVAPEQAVENFRTMQTVRSSALSTPRVETILVSLFAGLALLITVAGIAGVVAFSVSQRSHEIGIRMALGAGRGKVLRMVLQEGLALVTAGLAAGLAVSVWLGGEVAAFLYDIEPTDPVTYAGVALALLAATAVACWVPGRRATGIDPMEALRVE